MLVAAQGRVGPCQVPGRLVLWSPRGLNHQGASLMLALRREAGREGARGHARYHIMLAWKGIASICVCAGVCLCLPVCVWKGIASMCVCVCVPVAASVHVFVCVSESVSVRVLACLFSLYKTAHGH